MGEFARRISDGEEIKIGTCENMYYIRYEDRFKVSPLENSLDCSEEMDLNWRLPFPSEDGLQPGEYEDAFKDCLIGHIPFNEDMFWNKVWRLVRVNNSASGVLAVLESNQIRYKSFTTPLSEIIPYVKDLKLKERLKNYLS